ncbi:MAG TPA: ABC transporter permease [Arachnia sp.]|nr:ABC transporter permease [Arachnia sp.]HMR13016.1 ABC transporter permease [Arachnia sp.]
MTTPALPTSVLRWQDLFLEALAALLSRPARSILTCLGTVLGVGTLVTILGLTTTAQAQVSARFDALAATTVTVEDHHTTDPVFTPASVMKVLGTVNGVLAAGYYWPVKQVEDVRLLPTEPVRAQLDVTAASPGLFAAIGAEVRAGALFNAFHEEQAQPVVVVGEIAAQRLDLPDIALQPSILINDRPYQVIGILSETTRMPELLSSILIPTATSLERFGEPMTSGNNAATLLISTRPGAARQVADEVPWAITPQDVAQVQVIPPPDPRTLRESVDGDLSTLLLALAGICLFIGAVGIANTTLVAVMERTPEIGLRRSLGARSRHIFAQIITESSVLGVLGGLIGATLGVFAILVVSLAQGWTPVLDPGLVIAAPAIGLVVGALAGVQPSWQASRIQPTEALRR